MAKRDAEPCEWIDSPSSFRKFATHLGTVESARHIKPLHWYIACRLVLEGGFRPQDITPHPPFVVEEKRKRGRIRYLLRYDRKVAGTGEQVILGGLKTKNVDVVVARHPVGPVLAVSCKGVTKAFRNLTNRMEETVGECTNLHITYPAMVIGYFALLRANRTVQDVLEAPDVQEDEPGRVSVNDSENIESQVDQAVSTQAEEVMKANDIAILDSGAVTEGIVRFHAALCEMTGRRGLRDEISRYEAISLALIEPKGTIAGNVYAQFPAPDSPLRPEKFFSTLYERYEERFVFGAPLLADRRITSRLRWAPESPVFVRDEPGAASWPSLDFEPRLDEPLV